MPTEVSQVDPDATGDIRGDHGYTGAYVTTTTAGSIGIDVGKAGGTYFYYGRFDFDGIESGATIDGVQFTMTHTGSLDVNPQFNFGFLDRDGVWDNDDAFASPNYNNQDQAYLPLIEIGNGTLYDPTIFSADTHTDKILFLNKLDGMTTSFGEGIASDFTATGLTALAQAALDETSGLPLKLCLAIFRKWDPSDIANHYSSFYFADATTQAYRPTLRVDYTNPAGGALKAKRELTATVSARPDAHSLVSSSNSVKSTADAKLDGESTVRSRLGVEPSTKSRGDVS